MGKYIVAESNDLSMNLEMLAHFNTLYISERGNTKFPTGLFR